LTERDLAEVRPAGDSPHEDILAGIRRARRRGRAAPQLSSRRSHCRRRRARRAALLTYAPDDDGVAVDDLELTLPRDAAWWQRGVDARAGRAARVRAPVALGFECGPPFLALGVSANRRLRSTRLPRSRPKAGSAPPPGSAPAIEACRGVSRSA